MGEVIHIAPGRIDSREQFWSQVDICGHTECWPFKGYVRPDGYGWLNSGLTGKNMYAHRYAWESVFGPIPNGMHVRHKCGGKNCNNLVAHLRVGSAAENAMDESRLLAAGVEKSDGKGYIVKLEEWQVKEIRRRHEPYRVPAQLFAEEYEVGLECIYDVIHRRTWPLVEDDGGQDAEADERWAEVLARWNQRRARKHAEPMSDGRSKLSVFDVKDLVRQGRSGEVTRRELAARYGVSESYVSKLVKGQKRAWLDDTEPEELTGEATLPRAA